MGDVSVTTPGGMTFHLIFDAAADAAPQTFRDGVEQAARLLSQAIANPITVNIKIGYSGTKDPPGRSPPRLMARSKVMSQYRPPRCYPFLGQRQGPLRQALEPLSGDFWEAFSEVSCPVRCFPPISTRIFART